MLFLLPCWKQKSETQKLSNVPEANDREMGGAEDGEMGGAGTTTEFP